MSTMDRTSNVKSFTKERVLSSLWNKTQCVSVLICLGSSLHALGPVWEKAHQLIFDSVLICSVLRQFIACPRASVGEGTSADLY